MQFKKLLKRTLNLPLKHSGRRSLPPHWGLEKFFKTLVQKDEVHSPILGSGEIFSNSYLQILRILRSLTLQYIFLFPFFPTTFIQSRFLLRIARRGRKCLCISKDIADPFNARNQAVLRT